MAQYKRWILQQPGQKAEKTIMTAMAPPKELVQGRPTGTSKGAKRFGQ
jgi:hypothetical protein